VMFRIREAVMLLHMDWMVNHLIRLIIKLYTIPVFMAIPGQEQVIIVVEEIKIGSLWILHDGQLIIRKDTLLIIILSRMDADLLHITIYVYTSAMELRHGITMTIMN